MCVSAGTASLLPPLQCPPCVREGGMKRKVWQLKALLLGHPHRLPLPANPDSLSLVTCLQTNPESVGGSRRRHVARRWILLDTFIVFFGPSNSSMDAGCFN